MLFKIENLPKVDGKTLRGLKVKPLDQLPNRVKIREGMSLQEASKKIGIQVEKLDDFGIFGNEIDMEKLRSSLTSGATTEIQIRKEEKKNVDNLISAVIGRIGSEEEVFQRFDIGSLLNREDLPTEVKVACLKSFIKQLPFPDVQVDCLVQLSKGFDPDDPISQKKTAAALAVQLYSDDVDTLAKIVAGILNSFHPDDPHSQGRFMASVAHLILVPEILRSKNAFLSKLINYVSTNPVARRKFSEGINQEYHRKLNEN